MRNPFRRCMRPVGRRKRIVHIDIGKRRKPKGTGPEIETGFTPLRKSKKGADGGGEAPSHAPEPSSLYRGPGPRRDED